MAESENAQPQPQFAIQRIYVKDLSFETPNSPAIFTQAWDPKVNVDLNTKAAPLGEGVFEVVLALTVTASLDDKTAYLAEVQQAGIFNVVGFSEKDQGHMLHSYCPNVLFPYAREAIGSLVGRGSFPQLNLAPVNFDALYAEHLKQQASDEGTKH